MGQSTVWKGAKETQKLCSRISQLDTFYYSVTNRSGRCQLPISVYLLDIYCVDESTGQPAMLPVTAELKTAPVNSPGGRQPVRMAGIQ